MREKRTDAHRSVFHEVRGSLVVVVAMVLSLPFFFLLASFSSFILFRRACFPSRPGCPARPLPQCMYINNTPTLLPHPLRRRCRHRMRESLQHQHNSRGDAGAPPHHPPTHPQPPMFPSPCCPPCFTPRRSWARGSRRWSRCPRWGTPPRWAPRGTCAA